MRRLSLRPVAVSVAICLAFGGVALATQDRAALKVPGGLSFSDFEGYQNWANVAVSETKDQIKVISANSVMLKAFRSGLPAEGKTFPDGSKVVKIEWAQKQNPVSPYTVTVPGDLQALAFIEKDTKRFPKTHGWAYAVFNYDPKTDTLTPAVTGAECGYACHTRVSAQDYIYTAYPKR